MLRPRIRLYPGNDVVWKSPVGIPVVNEEKREESIEVVSVIDGIPSRRHIRYGQNRNRRLGNMSNHR